MGGLILQWTRLLLLFLAAVGGGGCATLISGTQQRVSVDSNVLGAIVTAPDGRMVYTPGEIDLVRGEEIVLEVTAPGYVPRRVQMRSEVNPLVAANCLCTGLVGIIIDVVTGGAYEYESPVFVHLEPDGTLLYGSQYYPRVWDTPGGAIEVAPGPGPTRLDADPGPSENEPNRFGSVASEDDEPVPIPPPPAVPEPESPSEDASQGPERVAPRHWPTLPVDASEPPPAEPQPL